jgi:hypothetical protein
MFDRARLWEFTTLTNASDRAGIVEPAFSSRTQALCFFLLLAFLLALPLLVDRLGIATREQSYDQMAEHHGAYTFMKEQIFETEGDIDILFLGSSVLWNAVDTRQVEDSLSRSLGRKATVVTLGFNFNGIDIPYAVLRDLVERRRVRLVVFSVPRLPFTEGPSTTAYKFLRYSDHPDVVDGLTLRSKVSLYACNVLESPRDILRILRSDQSRPSRFSDDLGANKELLGMDRRPERFQRFTPSPPVFDATELVYSSGSQSNFTFGDEELTAHQDHYLKHLESLLRENHIPLAMLNVPQYSERTNEKVVERLDWSKKFGRQIPVLGVSPKRLFAGLDERETELLHCDREHFNKNGNEYFTRAVMPGLMMVYRDYASKDF